MAQDEQNNKSPEKTIWLDLPTEMAKQVVGGFEIIVKIGEGGMGSVFKARQPLLNRVVALKVMAPGLNSNPDFVKRFIHEAASAANLAHPNMVLVYSAGEDAGRYYLAMEFVEGESVGERLERDGAIKPKDAVAITLNVATALNYAWQQARLIHRDIKPDNIFLSSKGEVKVGDLGLAKSLGEEATRMTSTGLMMGTPSYISPEQAMAEKSVDFRTDIYSLGCTLYHMLTGQTPYVAESGMAMAIKHINEPPPTITNAFPNCPHKLSKVVTRMMAKKPEARYQSYEELIAELTAVYHELPKGGQMMFTAPAKDGDGVKYAAIVAILLLGGLFWWAPWKHAVKPSTGQRPLESSAAAPPVADKNSGSQTISAEPASASVNANNATKPTIPALVQIGTATKYDHNTSYTVTLPAKPANGNTLIAVSLYHTAAKTVSSIESISQAGANWNHVVHTNGCVYSSTTFTNGSFVSEIWYAANILNAGTNITLNLIGNNNGVGAAVMEYSGLLPVNPVDGAAANGSPTAAMIADTGTTPMTTQPNELWLAAVGLNNLDSRLNPVTDGFTIVTNVLGQKIESLTKTAEYKVTFNLNILQKIVNATGTANFRGTFSPPSIWNGVVATFKAGAIVTSNTAQTTTPAMAAAIAIRSFKASFIKEKSMAPFPIGYKHTFQYYSEQTTADPDAVFNGIPVNFNQHTGKEIYYHVESTTPIVKVVFMGEGIDGLLEALDMTGKLLGSTMLRGGKNTDNSDKTTELNLSGATRFEIKITNKAPNWFLIKSIRLEDTNGVVPPVFPNENPTIK